ncbi:hypothetical protein, partial [Flexivirga lutea]
MDLAGLPGPVADALRLLVAEAKALGSRERGTPGRVRPERLGDVIQAAEAVKGFADAVLLDATSALVEDLAADHGVPVDDS